MVLSRDQFLTDHILQMSDCARILMSSRLVSSWDLPPRVATKIEYQRMPLDAGELDQQAGCCGGAIVSNVEWPEVLEYPLLDILGCLTSRWHRLHFAKIKLFEWVLSA